MSKMHELLAVEATIAGNYGRDLSETMHVFGKAHDFTKTVTTKKHFDSDNSHLDTSTVEDITTTVPDRLKWFGEIAKRYFDVEIQKDATNQKAVADIVLDDGKVLYKDVPATTLLMLETKLGVELRKMLVAIPTLDSNIVWDFDENENLWRAGGLAPTFVTKKTFVPLVLAPATDKHPAQVKEGFEDRPVASVTKQILSGMITSRQKATLLANLDALLAAVKKARQRANSTEVVMTKDFGESIVGFITKDLKAGG